MPKPKPPEILRAVFMALFLGFYLMLDFIYNMVYNTFRIWFPTPLSREENV